MSSILHGITRHIYIIHHDVMLKLCKINAAEMRILHKMSYSDDWIDT